MTGFFFFFFFQAEDGIRDVAVTGVQTCALPISSALVAALARQAPRELGRGMVVVKGVLEIGRASCREKSVDLGGRRIIKKKKKKKQKKKTQIKKKNEFKIYERI